MNGFNAEWVLNMATIVWTNDLRIDSCDVNFVHSVNTIHSFIEWRLVSSVSTTTATKDTIDTNYADDASLKSSCGWNSFDFLCWCCGMVWLITTICRRSLNALFAFVINSIVSIQFNAQTIRMKCIIERKESLIHNTFVFIPLYIVDCYYQK